MAGLYMCDGGGHDSPNHQEICYCAGDDDDASCPMCSLIQDRRKRSEQLAAARVMIEDKLGEMVQ